MSKPGGASCADPESSVRGGRNLITFYFLVDGIWGIEDPKIDINGPSSARQRNAIEMAYRWRADDGPTLDAGFVALWLFRGSGPVLQRNPIFLWFFRGGGGADFLPPSGSAHKPYIVANTNKEFSWSRLKIGFFWTMHNYWCHYIFNRSSIDQTT